MTTLTAETLLALIDKGDIENSREVCKKQSWDHEQLVGISKSLVSKGMLLETLHTVQVIALTKEGKSVLEKGSPEYRVYEAVPASGISKPDLEVGLFEGDRGEDSNMSSGLECTW